MPLKTDAPAVVEAPPPMLGFLQDGLQRYLSDIGPLGPDKGAGGKFLVLPLRGKHAGGLFRRAFPHLFGGLFCERFQSEGKTDQAVGLIALGHIDAFDARVADSDQL